MYEAVHDIWIAETGDCNNSYEDFRWAWFVGMCVPININIPLINI